MTFDDYVKENKVSTDERCGFYTITPEFAEECLRKSNGNPRGHKVEVNIRKFAKDIIDGNWKRNGEAIVFDENGVLKDGHNRLYAIIKADKPVVMFIVFGAEPTKRYDYGANRNVKDEIGISTLGSQISKSIQKIVEEKESFAVGETIDFTNEYRQLIEKAEDIILSGKRSRGVGSKAMCGAVVAAMLKSGTISEKDMRMFFTVVNTGNPIGCPKYAAPAVKLREQLMEKAAKYAGGGRASQKIHLSTTYLALVDFAKNKTRIRLRGYDLDNDAGLLFIRNAFSNQDELEIAA